MGHRCIYEDRLQIENGMLVRVINARWGSKSVKAGNVDVFKHFEDGRCLCRYLYRMMIGGYKVEYDGTAEEWAETIVDCNAFVNVYSFSLTDEDAELIKSRYPKFRWMLDKLRNMHGDITRARVFQFMNAWKLWPECERLLNGGYEKLCLSESFAKAPYMVQKEMFSFLQHHPEIVDPGFGELQYIMKTGISQEVYELCRKFNTDSETIEYYKKQLKKRKWKDGIKDVNIMYRDYVRIGSGVGHDMNDPYWKYPNNMHKAHDKVVAEAAAIRRAKEHEKEEAFRKSVEKWIGKEVKDGKITVHVSGSIKEWEHQAETLHQCLMYGNYMEDVTEGKCLLLFVMYDGEPMATAEIDSKGKIVLFYADQESEDMTPTPEADVAVRKWLKTYKPKLKEAA